MSSVFIGGELKHGLLTGRVHLGNDHHRSCFTIVIKIGSCRVAKLCGQVFRNVICSIQPSLVQQVMAQGEVASIRLDSNGDKF